MIRDGARPARVGVSESIAAKAYRLLRAVLIDGGEEDEIIRAQPVPGPRAPTRRTPPSGRC